MYRKGVPHGQGLRAWPNGDTFEGEFVNGLPDGQGCFSWSERLFPMPSHLTGNDPCWNIILQEIEGSLSHSDFLFFVLLSHREYHVYLFISVKHPQLGNIPKSIIIHQSQDRKLRLFQC